MSEDMNIIDNLKKISSMMDGFIKQRNMCNKTMVMVENELEKVTVFVKKLGLHINECKNHSIKHKKSVSDFLTKHKDDDADDATLTKAAGGIDNLSMGIENSVDELVDDFTTSSTRFSKNLMKVINSRELTKDELKKRLRSLHKYHNKISKKHARELSSAIGSLRNTRENQVSIMKTSNKDVIRDAIREEKIKFSDMLQKEIEKHEADENEEMNNVQEVLMAINEAMKDLQDTTRKQPIKTVKELSEMPKSRSESQSKSPVIITISNDDAAKMISPVKQNAGNNLENKLENILYGGKLLDGVLKLKKRKKKAGKSFKNKNKNKKHKKKHRRTIRFLFKSK